VRLREQLLVCRPCVDVHLLCNHTICAGIAASCSGQRTDPIHATWQGSCLQSVDSQPWQHPRDLISERSRRVGRCCFSHPAAGNPNCESRLSRGGLLDFDRGRRGPVPLCARCIVRRGDGPGVVLNQLRFSTHRELDKK